MPPRAGWNATRRNRNIGTAKAGHGQDNRLTIPDPRHFRNPYWTELRNHRATRRELHGRPLHFIIEPTHAGWVHPCTVEDVLAVLQALPPELLCAPEEDYQLSGVIFRQRSRKQEVLCPVWGRLVYWADLRPIEGPAIVLEAQQLPCRSRWGRRLRVDDRAELQRLLTEADEVHADRNGHRLTFGLEGLRRVMLYRTLLHELGHLVDHWDRVVRPAARGGDWTELDNAYDRRPTREREDAAHGFAERWSAALRAQQVIPFARKLDDEVLAADGLSPEWFLPGPP